MTENGNTALSWDGEQWRGVTAPWATGECYGRPNGDVCFFRPHVGLCITRDSGRTWVVYRQQPNGYDGGSEKVDAYYYANTGNFRWQSSNDNQTKITVYTFELNSGNMKAPAVWQPQSPDFVRSPVFPDSDLSTRGSPGRNQ